MSIIPRDNFSPDETMLLTLDKASLMKAILAQTPVQSEIPTADERTEVMVVDGMVEAQALTKKPSTTKMLHLKQQFNTRIHNKARRVKYTELRTLFDEYRPFSLKSKTRQKRSQRSKSEFINEDVGFEFHDEMNIKKTSIADILATSTSKKQLTVYLAHGLLEEYEGNLGVKLIVSYDSKIEIHKPHTLDQGFTSHGHEEADTQIPMHILNSLSDSTYKHIDVYSPDTDVLVLLMDLVSHGHVGPLTNLLLHAGKGRDQKVIDIVNRVSCIGQVKCQGLVGLHNFTGNDYGGMFVGISKERWCKLYLELPADHDIVRALGCVGSLTTEECVLDNGNLSVNVRPLESFTCRAYDANGPSTLPALRWKLFSTKNKEAENLPPCRATLSPHIQRTNYLSRVYKSYHETHPIFPDLLESGWTRHQNASDVFPVHCFLPPAPKSIMELVKCCCKAGDCSSNHCSCHKSSMPCTPLCSCSDVCSNT